MPQTGTGRPRFDDLFRQCYRPLCLYALHYVPEYETVEDIVQDCFAILWEKWEAEGDVRNPSAYLYRMVHNRCMDRLRQETGNVSLEGMSEDHLGSEEMEPDGPEMEDAEIEARLWGAIDRLPQKRREIFLLNKRDGQPYQAIADQLGISVFTVRNQISKALSALREGILKIYSFFFLH